MEKKLWLIDFLLTLYLAYLTYFEKPFWCINKGDFMTNNCQEDIYGNTYNLLLFFNFHQKYIFLISSLIMAYFNIKYVVAYMAMKQTLKISESNRKLKLMLASTLNVLHFMFYFMAKDGIVSIDGCSIVKTIFLCLVVDFLFVNLKKVFSYLTNFYEIFLLFFLNWIFVAALVEVLFVAFPTYYDNEVHYSFNFNNYFKTLFSVFVFFTGNNSPDMFMKRFPANGLLTYSFIFVIWCNNLIVTGFLIGLSYYKMKLMMISEIKKVVDSPSPRVVFEKLQNHPNADRKIIKKYLKIHMRNQQDDYLPIEQIILQSQSNRKEMVYVSEKIYDELKRSRVYEGIYGLLGLACAIYVLVVVQNKAFQQYQNFLFMILLCSIQLMDFLHAMFFRHDYSLDRNWKTYLDTCLSLVLIGFSFKLYRDVEDVVLIKVWAFFALLKMFRIVVLMFKFDRERMKGNVLYPIYKFVSDLILQILVVFLIFASLGLNFFGGDINSFAIDVYNEDMGTELDYERLNFNTILNALVFLFVVSLNNDWPVLANICIINNGTGNRRLMRFLFIFFKFLVNYLLLNSIIAFMIEVLHDYERKRVLENKGKPV